MHEAHAAGRVLRTPPPLPCPVHGDVPELWPENRYVWDLFWQVVDPHAIRTEYERRGRRLVRIQRLDLPALETICRVYPVGDQRVFLDKIRTIFEVLQED